MLVNEPDLTREQLAERRDKGMAKVREMLGAEKQAQPKAETKQAPKVEQAKAETKQAEPAPAPPAKEEKVAAPTPTMPAKAPVGAAEAKKIPVAKPKVTAKPKETPAQKARKAEIEKQYERIDEKLFDLENEGRKSSAKLYLKGLVAKGVIDKADFDSLDYLFKDKDMGVEDVVSDIRGTIEDSKERALAEVGGPKLKRQVAGPKPTYVDPHGRPYFYPKAVEQSATLTGKNQNVTYMYIGGDHYDQVANGTAAQDATEAKQAGLGEGTAAGAVRPDAGTQTPSGGEGQLELFPGMDFGKATLPETVTVDGIERPTSNADGQPIASTTQAVKNFWNWFGDSKAVNDDGHPIVFYHGTRTVFDEFGNWKPTHFFSDNPAVAKTYTRNSSYGAVLPVYLRINDIIEYNAEGRSWTEVVHDEGGEHSYDDIQEARNRYIEDELESFDADANRLEVREREKDGETVYDVVNPRRHWQAETVEDEVLATFDTEDEAQDDVVERVDEETREHIDNLDTDEWALINNGYLDPAVTYMTTDDIADMAQGDYDAVWIEDVDDTAGSEGIPSTVVIILKGSEESRAPRSIKSATENIGEFSPESSKFRQRAAEKTAATKKSVAVDMGDVAKYHDFLAKHADAVWKALGEMGITKDRADLTVETMSKWQAEARKIFDAGQFEVKDSGEMILRVVALPNFNSSQTARHEAIHWMREVGIITPQEWKVLAKWAENNKSLIAWAEANYQGETREGRIEEAVAEGFRAGSRAIRYWFWPRAMRSRNSSSACTRCSRS